MTTEKEIELLRHIAKFHNAALGELIPLLPSGTALAWGHWSMARDLIEQLRDDEAELKGVEREVRR